MPRTLQTPARASKSSPRKASTRPKSPRKAMATRTAPSARKPTSAPKRSAKARAKSGAPTGRRPSTPIRSELPGWGDLDASRVAKTARTARSRKASATAPSRLDWLTRVPTRSFLLAIALVCSVLTLWVAHVFSMEATLDDITQLRAENEQLHLRRARLEGEFDQRTSPAIVLDRARALGLEEDAAYAPTIVVD